MGIPNKNLFPRNLTIRPHLVYIYNLVQLNNVALLFNVNKISFYLMSLQFEYVTRLIFYKR